MTTIVAPTDEAIVEAANRLRDGRLVAIPTETVYGLAANASDAAAVARVFAAKGRPANHPLIVHIASAEHIDRWAVDVPPQAIALAQAFWPGPLTMLLKRASHVLDEVTGHQSSVGLRCPSHPVAQALLREFSRDRAIAGLAAPSANKYGRISPTLASHVAADHSDADLWVLDGGACDVGIESTLIDCSRIDSGRGMVMLRPGAIAVDRIEDVANMRVLAPDAQAPRSSGTLASHYAPIKRLRLIERSELVAFDARRAKHSALLAFAPQPDLALTWAWSTFAQHDPHVYAHGLYGWLRAMDASTAAELFVERPPASLEWRAIADRLTRAAQH